MIESTGKDIAALPKIPVQWLLAAGTIGSFVWLLLGDRIDPLVVYLLQVYLTF